MPARRLYDTPRWRQMRAAYFKVHPLCPDCSLLGRTVVATHLDHVLSVAERPDLAWDWSNLRGLCHAHHSEKTAQVDGAFGRKKGRRCVKGCDLSGWPIDPNHPWLQHDD